MPFEEAHWQKGWITLDRSSDHLTLFCDYSLSNVRSPRSFLLFLSFEPQITVLSSPPSSFTPSVL
ncbi:hypothetical protein SLEP1_g49735 [Rubroshorea leprosula]|uniref:Uncharacterized protein n=1 Tax=Rubroshorea leprosula TaxID=152421 RepID=A0AAV5LZV5_9ROSI|nr:hypothetical protein SLEP1_g49735 [Rubroshorea leprosula]